MKIFDKIKILDMRILLLKKQIKISGSCCFGLTEVNILKVGSLTATLRSGDTVTNDRIERCCYC